jgi:hypothetical protein
VFTARYALSPYIKQIRFVFKRLMKCVYTLPRSALVLSVLEDSSRVHQNTACENLRSTIWLESGGVLSGDIRVKMTDDRWRIRHGI